MEFIVEGKPQGKARARTFYDQRQKKMRSITPEQTVSYENLIRWSYKAAGGEYMGDKTLLQVDIQAFYPMPKQFSKAKKTAANNGDLRPQTKPDCDNVAKAVLDALNGVAYYDDKQVVCLSVNKYYGEAGYLQITIDEI